MPDYFIGDIESCPDRAVFTDRCDRCGRLIRRGDRCSYDKVKSTLLCVFCRQNDVAKTEKK